MDPVLSVQKQFLIISYRKCTLKDGVLTVNNREYVFHKATGEYEW